MELVERYLQAVRFWLPKQGKQDILAELSEDIRTQIEEWEGGLGRKLTNEEVKTLLKERGRPVLVANAYLPQRYLIGPQLFPIYTFVLKIVGLGYLVPWVMTWVGMMFFSPNYRETHAGSHWMAALAGAWGQMWTAAFVAIGVVTIVFAILEQLPQRAELFEGWDPTKLPKVRDPNLIPRTTSAFEVAANVVLLLWWSAKMGSTLVINQPDLMVWLSPSWHVFFWGCLILWMGSTAMAAFNLARPYWTVERAVIRLMYDVAGGAFFCWFTKANILSSIHVANISPERAAALVNGFNMWLGRWCFPGAVMLFLVIIGSDIYRIMRVRGRSSGFSMHAVAAAAVLMVVLTGIR